MHLGAAKAHGEHKDVAPFVHQSSGDAMVQAMAIESGTSPQARGSSPPNSSELEWMRQGLRLCVAASLLSLAWCVALVFFLHDSITDNYVYVVMNILLCVLGIGSDRLVVNASGVNQLRILRAQSCIMLALAFIMSISHWSCDNTNSKEAFVKMALEGVLVPLFGSVLLLTPFPLLLLALCLWAVPFLISTQVPKDFAVGYMLCLAFLAVVCFFVKKMLYTRFLDQEELSQYRAARARGGIDVHSSSTLKHKGAGSGSNPLISSGASNDIALPPEVYDVRDVFSGSNFATMGLQQPDGQSPAEQLSSGPGSGSENGTGSASDNETTVNITFPDDVSLQHISVDFDSAAFDGLEVPFNEMPEPTATTEATRDSGPLGATDWVAQNRDMFTLCTAVGNDNEPILMNLSCEALGLVAMNTATLCASNRKCTEMCRLIGNGNGELGRKMLVEFVLKSLSAQPGSTSCFAHFSCAGSTKAHLRVNTGRSRCGQYLVLAILYSASDNDSPISMPFGHLSSGVPGVVSGRAAPVVAVEAQAHQDGARRSDLKWRQFDGPKQQARKKKKTDDIPMDISPLCAMPFPSNAQVYGGEH